MERIELPVTGLRVDAQGAGIIVKQEAGGAIELTVLQDGAPVATLRVPVDSD